MTEKTTGDAIVGAIVTFTSTTSNVTFNDTSAGALGTYSISLPEDTYLRQVVAPNCSNDDPPAEITLVEMFSPYTSNFFMNCF